MTRNEAPQIAYKSPYATVYLGDCRALAIPRGSVDLMVTDPPYGVEWQSSFRREAFDVMQGDGDVTAYDALTSLVKAVHNGGHVYVFGGDEDALRTSLRLSSTVTLIWNKDRVGLGALERSWSKNYEPVVFGAYIPSPSDRARGDGRLSARLRRGAVVTVPRHAGRAVKRHPTEKPVALLRQFIESSSVLGDVVFDPFAGVLSTAVAAIATGRRAVVCEIDPKYVEIGIDRIKEAEGIARHIEKL